MQRKKELTKQYHDGTAIGKAVVQHYIDLKRSGKEADFTPALTTEEINFLKSTIKIDDDKRLFEPYSLMHKLLRKFAHWIEHYEHIYYHGLFRDLAVIQTPDYDIQIYHMLKSQTQPDENAIQKFKARYMQSLEPIVDILMHNWENLIEFPIQKLCSYSIRLEKVQELTKFDLTPLLPDIKHHINEIKELQRLARCFQDNLNRYINNNNFEVGDDVLSALDNLINIDTNNLQLSEEERENEIQSAINMLNAVREETEYSLIAGE